MTMNLLAELGLIGQRAVIIHHDDLGLTPAQDEAHRRLTCFPSGSIIVPAGWAKNWAAEPATDLGVHLTLTSPLEPLRQRPLTSGASLCDADGYFWPTLEQAWTQIKTDEAEAELRAQARPDRGSLGVGH